jgi:hypothetical protein
MNSTGGFVTSVNFFRRQGANAMGSVDGNIPKTAKGADNRESSGRGLQLVAGASALRN